MKTIFIPAKSKIKFDKSKINELSKKLPKQIAIAYSIQYKELAEQIKKSIPSTSFTQVLGCSKPKLSKNTKAILLISDGKFHATSLAFETKLPVYLFNNHSLTEISKKEIEVLEKKQKASYLKFLHADKIGILVSTKPGQQNIKKAIEFKKKQKIPSYLFICNNINTNEFENFDIDSWVNTACPRLTYDNAQINNINQVN